MEMMFLDPISFDQQHYDFSYVRRDFLGAVRTLVFDVHPKPGTGSGRFTGRIWVEDQAGNIVRFNGTYTGGNQDDDSSSYFHFDSWRENLQPGLWLPVGVYVEETQKSSEHPVSFKAQTYIWGYSLKLPTHESDNESVKIDDVQDQSAESQDLSPLAAQREWISQAEENVLDRLVQAGASQRLRQGPGAGCQQHDHRQQHPDDGFDSLPCVAHRPARIAGCRQHHHPEQGPDRRSGF
jgi:hypothetical protein